MNKITITLDEFFNPTKKATEEKVDLLTPHQKETMENIFQAFEEGNKSVILTGSAGTGKTFLVAAFIEEFYKRHQKKGIVYVTAPTNKAVSILMEKAGGHLPWYFKYVTIHKALNWKRFINPENGEWVFKTNPTAKTPPFNKGILRVVDEASMVDSAILEDIKKSTNILTLYVGDKKQLPPINEDESPVFLEDYPNFELLEIIRQKEGNQIINLSQNLQYLGLEKDNLILDKGYHFDRDYNCCVDKVLEDIDNTRYLAWTNVSVNTFNKNIRQRLYGSPSKIELGELLILAQPYENYWTNYELKVKSLEVREKDFYITKDKKVSFYVYIINSNIYAIHESSEKDFYTILKSLKKDAVDGNISWASYYTFTESFLKFNYLYGITVHKSQGSTYKKTIINVNDLNLNTNRKEKERLWYTAITRASDKITLYKSPFKSSF